MNRLWAVIATPFSALAVAAYLVLPGMWQWNRAEALAATTGGRQPVVQVDTLPPPSDPALVEKLQQTCPPVRRPRR